MSDWKPVTPADDAPNPVVATRRTRDGGTARLYRNGMVDAVDGECYSLSAGFDSYDALDRWIAREQRRTNP